MSIKQRIADDMKQAMRDKDIDRRESLRMLRAAIQRREVDERIELDDAQTLAVVEKLVKQGRDAITQFEQGGRADLAEKERRDVDILSGYLPEQLDETAIEREVSAAIEASGASGMRDMGKVMALLKPALQGRADMGAVSARVKSMLQG